jgi:hypothetical protein
VAVLDEDADLLVYDPAVLRLLDSDYDQEDFSAQRTAALLWLYRCMDVHNPNGIDESEEDRADGYKVETPDLEKAAAYYCLYLIYEAVIKEPGDAFDIKASHWKDRAFETLNMAIIEFDTDGDGDTNYQYNMSSPRMGRG